MHRPIEAHIWWRPAPRSLLGCADAYRVVQVLSLHGNAVLGYQQHFDIEGDSGIVGRAFGTAARIVFRVPRSLRDQRNDDPMRSPAVSPAYPFPSSPSLAPASFGVSGGSAATATTAIAELTDFRLGAPATAGVGVGAGAGAGAGAGTSTVSGNSMSGSSKHRTSRERWMADARGWRLSNGNTSSAGDGTAADHVAEGHQFRSNLQNVQV